VLTRWPCFARFFKTSNAGKLSKAKRCGSEARFWPYPDTAKRCWDSTDATAPKRRSSQHLYQSHGKHRTWQSGLTNAWLKGHPKPHTGEPGLSSADRTPRFQAEQKDQASKAPHTALPLGAHLTPVREPTGQGPAAGTAGEAAAVSAHSWERLRGGDLPRLGRGELLDRLTTLRHPICYRSLQTQLRCTY